MSQVTLEVPEETMLALRATTESAAGQLQLAAAMKLFEMGRLSAGAASSLAGLPKPAFLSRLGEYGINSFQLSEAELLLEQPLA